MISFNLITGFLGSGKTTMLKHVLSELSPKKRIAVIQNEFAPTGIDGKELKNENQDFKLIEINNGSVFCVCQLNSFVNSLLQLINEYKPEIIFLEASGLADPISIIELLQTKELEGRVRLNKIVCVVDAINFFNGLNKLVRFKHQIMIADHIAINKVDGIEADLNSIVEEIKKLNAFAVIKKTSFANLNWSDIDTAVNFKTRAASRYIGTQSEGRPDINACVLRTHEKISEPQLKAFLLNIQEQCIRIKGFVNLIDGRVFTIHSVYEKLEILELNNYSGPSELIVFGNDITISGLRSLFKSYYNNSSQC